MLKMLRLAAIELKMSVKGQYLNLQNVIGSVPVKNVSNLIKSINAAIETMNCSVKKKKVYVNGMLVPAKPKNVLIIQKSVQTVLEHLK